jgi:DNA-binding transcriptional LysR family regulator
MRSLNLDQLRTLLEVIEHGSFSAAARRLNLTQPAISLQVRELEGRYGVRLVERLGRRALPTVPGRELIEVAQHILRECNRADSVMRRFRDGWIGHVRLATTNTALMYELPPILRRLRVDHPGLELHVTNMPTRESIESIMQNTIDLALVTLPVASKYLRITPLREQKLVAIFPAGTRNVPDEVTPEFVARQPLVIEHTRGAVYALIMRWLTGQMPLPRAPMHLGTVEALKTAVTANLGMSIVPDVSVAQPTSDLVVRPLRPAVPATLALVEHRNKPIEPALDIVREALLGLRKVEPMVPLTTRRTRRRRGRKPA